MVAVDDAIFYCTECMKRNDVKKSIADIVKKGTILCVFDDDEFGCLYRFPVCDGVRLKVERVNGDGSCLYNSFVAAISANPRAIELAKQKLNVRGEITPIMLKNAMVKWMKKPDNHFEQVLAGTLYTRNVKEYVKNYVQGNRWGGQVEIMALARLLGMAIDVFNIRGNSWLKWDVLDQDAPVLRLVFQPLEKRAGVSNDDDEREGHYDALIEVTPESPQITNMYTEEQMEQADDVDYDTRSIPDTQQAQPTIPVTQQAQHGHTQNNPVTQPTAKNTRMIYAPNATPPARSEPVFQAHALPGQPLSERPLFEIYPTTAKGKNIGLDAVWQRTIDAFNLGSAHGSFIDSYLETWRTHIQSQEDVWHYAPNIFARWSAYIRQVAYGHEHDPHYCVLALVLYNYPIHRSTNKSNPEQDAKNKKRKNAEFTGERYDISVDQIDTNYTFKKPTKVDNDFKAFCQNKLHQLDKSINDISVDLIEGQPMNRVDRLIEWKCHSNQPREAGWSDSRFTAHAVLYNLIASGTTMSGVDLMKSTISAQLVNTTHSLYHMLKTWTRCLKWCDAMEVSVKACKNKRIQYVPVHTRNMALDFITTWIYAFRCVHYDEVKHQTLNSLFQNMYDIDVGMRQLCVHNGVQFSASLPGDVLDTFRRV